MSETGLSGTNNQVPDPVHSSTCEYQHRKTQLGHMAGTLVKKVQWDNLNFGFAFIERLENLTVLKKIYSIWLEFPCEGSEQEEH